MPFEVKRGEMYIADLRPAVGSEQDGIRPVLIVQNNVGNRHSPTAIVAAITGIAKKPYMPTHVPLPAGNGLEMPSIVLLEQIRTIDKSRLLRYIGQLEEPEMKGIDCGLAVSLGIEMDKKKKKRGDTMLLTLCHTCAQQFYNTNEYIVRRANPKQTVRDTCSYCGCRQGFDFTVKNKDRRAGK
jgi:mRNA interferase MazF